MSATELRSIDWTDEAVANLDMIINYVREFNPTAAVRLAERLIATADRLAEFRIAVDRQSRAIVR